MIDRLANLRAQLEAAVADCRQTELAELVGLLEAAKVRAMARALSPSPPTTDVVDVATLAAELDLAESWLRAQARSGKLPHLRCGKHIRFRRTEVLAALEHRMGSPERAKKRRENKAALPDCYQPESAQTDGETGANGGGKP